MSTRLLVAAIVPLLASACGGGGTDDGATTSAQRPTTPTAVQTVTVPDTARLEPTPDGDPAFTVALRGRADATAGRSWTYTVRATTDTGAPASGTAKMRVFADGELADTLGWFPFEGTLTKAHRWPASLVGKDVVLQAEVEGAGGTVRKNLPVTVSSQ